MTLLDEGKVDKKFDVVASDARELEMGTSPSGPPPMLGLAGLAAQPNGFIHTVMAVPFVGPQVSTAVPALPLEVPPAPVVPALSSISASDSNASEDPNKKRSRDPNSKLPISKAPRVKAPPKAKAPKVPEPFVPPTRTEPVSDSNA